MGGLKLEAPLYSSDVWYSDTSTVGSHFATSPELRPPQN